MGRVVGRLVLVLCSYCERKLCKKYGSAEFSEAKSKGSRKVRGQVLPFVQRPAPSPNRHRNYGAQKAAVPHKPMTFSSLD